MQMLRKAMFIMKGMVEYTRAGYNRASKHFEDDDTNLDLTGKSIAITGANSGIGLEASLALAEKGAQLLIICRDKARGIAALEKVKARSKDGVEPHLYVLDMSKPRNIHKFIREFRDSGQQLDVLVNNAGCMIQQRSDFEGIETNFSTNTLGEYALTWQTTDLLIENLKQIVNGCENVEIAKNSRHRKYCISVTVSSAGMLTQGLNYDDFNNMKGMKDTFDGTTVYAQNKRQQVVMMEEFSLGYPDIFFASMHPGWVNTESVKSSMPGFYKIMHSILRTPAQGADTIVWLCSMNNIDRKFRNGQLFQDRLVVNKHFAIGGTKSSPEQNKLFINSLDGLSKKFEQ